MRPGDELTATLAAVTGLLCASTDVAARVKALGGGRVLDHIHADSVPSRDAPAPWVVISAAEGKDTLRLGGDERFLTESTVTVKVVTVGESTVPGASLLAAMCATLQGNKNLSTHTPGLGDGEEMTVLTSRRTGTFRYPERSDGLEYRHVGAYFTIAVQ